MFIDTVLAPHCTWQQLVAKSLVEDSQKGFRQGARKVHPDVNSDPRAEEAFMRLSELYDQREGHGSNRVLYNERGFTFERTPAGAFLYSMSYPDDSDLYKQATSAMVALQGAEKPAFFPEFVHRHHDAENNRVAAEVKWAEGDWWMLNDFGELHPRDVVWIGKRLFLALHLAHQQGVIHADINDSAVLINPEEHGVVLHAWGASVKRGKPLQIRPVHGANTWSVGDEELDIWLAAKTLIQHAPHVGSVYKFLDNATRGSRGTSLNMMHELSAAAEADFGPPQFHVTDTSTLKTKSLAKR